jgi:DNA repair protein RecO (recombination protein O)
VDTRAERLQAFVLRTLPYGESDLILHLLVRGKGRLSAFARGARGGGKGRQRFGGALEPFQLVEVLLAEARSSDMLALRESSLLEPYTGLRQDLARLAHAGYLAELLHDLTRAGQPADGLFTLACHFCTRLAAASATSARLRALELGALEAAGLSPSLSRCARCGGGLPTGKVAFDPAAGGAICSGCAAPSALLLTVGARAALCQLQKRGLEGAEAPTSADGSGRPADPHAFEEACAQAARPIAEFLLHHLGRRLRTLDFLEQVGAPR